MRKPLPNLLDLDRVIHEPARLLLVALLSSADFLFLLKESSLTKGNLSVHLARLEDAGYLSVEKSFRGKIPHTEYKLAPKGVAAFNGYRRSLAPILSKKKGNDRRL